MVVLKVVIGVLVVIVSLFLTLKLLRLRVLVLICFRSIVIVWLLFALIWIFMELFFVSTFTSLNWVWLDTRLILFRRDLISFWIEDRLDLELVSVVVCIVSLRIRCKLLLISDSAFSVVCVTEISSLALRVVWVRFLMLEVKRLVIVWFVALFFALLIRKLEDRRSIEFDSVDWFLLILFWVISERLLVLMICVMIRYFIL